MISVEFGYCDDLTQLLEVKTIAKMRVAKVPIRVNKNIVASLAMGSYLNPAVYNGDKSFYTLSKKGKKAKLVVMQANFTLEQYKLTDIHDYAEKQLGRKLDKRLVKVYDSMCHCCGSTIVGSPCYIEDIDGNEGNYCDDCMNTHTYEEMVNIGKQ